MASDEEDEELMNLRSAVLASLKTNTTKTEQTGDKPAEDEDDDLEALRLAALQSKKQEALNDRCDLTRPLKLRTRKDIHQRLHKPDRQTNSPVPLTSRSNLITIPLQDFSSGKKENEVFNRDVRFRNRPSLPAKQSIIVPVVKGSAEPKNDKFSRFDSESESEEEDWMQDEQKSSDEDIISDDDCDIDAPDIDLASNSSSKGQNEENDNESDDNSDRNDNADDSSVEKGDSEKDISDKDDVSDKDAISEKDDVSDKDNVSDVEAASEVASDDEKSHQDNESESNNQSKSSVEAEDELNASSAEDDADEEDLADQDNAEENADSDRDTDSHGTAELECDSDVSVESNKEISSESDSESNADSDVNRAPNADSDNMTENRNRTKHSQREVVMRNEYANRDSSSSLPDERTKFTDSRTIYRRRLSRSHSPKRQISRNPSPKRERPRYSSDTRLITRDDLTVNPKVLEARRKKFETKGVVDTKKTISLTNIVTAKTDKKYAMGETKSRTGEREETKSQTADRSEIKSRLGDTGISKKPTQSEGSSSSESESESGSDSNSEDSSESSTDSSSDDSDSDNNDSAHPLDDSESESESELSRFRQSGAIERKDNFRTKLVNSLNEKRGSRYDRGRPSRSRGEDLRREIFSRRKDRYRRRSRSTERRRNSSHSPGRDYRSRSPGKDRYRSHSPRRNRRRSLSPKRTRHKSESPDRERQRSHSKSGNTSPRAHSSVVRSVASSIVKVNSRSSSPVPRTKTVKETSPVSDRKHREKQTTGSLSSKKKDVGESDTRKIIASSVKSKDGKERSRSRRRKHSEEVTGRQSPQVQVTFEEGSDGEAGPRVSVYKRLGIPSKETSQRNNNNSNSLPSVKLRLGPKVSDKRTVMVNTEKTDDLTRTGKSNISVKRSNEDNEPTDDLDPPRKKLMRSNVWSRREEKCQAPPKAPPREVEKVKAKVKVKEEEKSSQAKEDELEERIRKIKEKNAAILKRQQEIEADKQKYG
ncbi:dentin sialophosphoprotein-like [Ptychodera flava]|uniref:dentin sialophosphoprotein-like n=1 Tax=Ptychodera flava TaxID=63121 RepID=UPI00396A53CC